MTTPNDKERLLNILHAHGQQFLSAFDIPPSKREANYSDGSESAESEEEWTGFGSSTNRSSSDAEHESDFEQDDDFAGSSSRIPDVTVFSDQARKRRQVCSSSKELKKLFMSSKVCNITSSSIRPISKGRTLDEESEDERTNTQNDALLHRLVHTRLLSGSLNPELDLDHAQKGRALAGRVLELAGKAKLGKGENMVRLEQRNKAARHVRDGLTRKQKEREQTALEEAKNLGNYHPTLKHLYNSNPPIQKKKRTRGLGMGVGKFVGGTLKLSPYEIASVTGSEKRSTKDNYCKMRQRPR